MSEERLAELEMRVAFQEQHLQELSDELYRQQQQVSQLDRLCRLLLQKWQELPSAPGKPGDEKPPHY